MSYKKIEVIKESKSSERSKVWFGATEHFEKIVIKRINTDYHTDLILTDLNHINIIKLLDVIWLDKLCAEIILEYADFTLHQCIYDIGIPEKLILDFSKQIARGLAYIHNKNILHLDLKPENILIHNGIIKICDFGLADFINSEDKSMNVITLYYRPPEIIIGCESYGAEVDIWSLGCIIQEMFDKKILFDRIEEDELLELICEVIGPFPHEASVSQKKFDNIYPKENSEILPKLYPLTKDILKYKNRPTAKQIIKML